MKTIRVVVADDHTLVRAGICALLREIPGVDVVGEAGDGHEALKLARHLRPDVVLLDIAMAGLNGLEVARLVTKEMTGIYVIILSMYANEEYVIQALSFGAAGYVLKDAELAELELALRSAVKGECYLSPAISKRVILSYLGRVNTARAEGDDGTSFETLTPRQREIVQLVAEGQTTKEIAKTLGLSAKTVDAHRTQAMERIGVHDVAGLVRYAIKSGIITVK